MPKKYEHPTSENILAGMIQGYDAVYQKLNKDSAVEGVEINPEWFVNTSGPIRVEQICMFWLEKIYEGDVEDVSLNIQKFARNILENFGYR